MTMTARSSKFVLTTHIIFSVGWLGAVAVFLALAITGLTSPDTELTRSAYLAMEMSGWLVIVPFCMASLFTGLVQALGTKWGLFKHYWIAVKLLLTIAATIILLLHMKPIGYLAGIAAGTSFSNTLLVQHYWCCLRPRQYQSISLGAKSNSRYVTTSNIQRRGSRVQPPKNHGDFTY